MPAVKMGLDMPPQIPLSLNRSRVQTTEIINVKSEKLIEGKKAYSLFCNDEPFDEKIIALLVKAH